MQLLDQAVAAAREARDRGCRLVVNPAPVEGLDAVTLRTADPLVVNEHEAAGLLRAHGGETTSLVSQVGDRMLRAAVIEWWTARRSSGEVHPVLGLNSRVALIMVYLGGALGVNTFLMYGFFNTVPKELDEAAKIERQYERGVITDTERRGELIEIWTRARAEASQAMVDNCPTTNPVWVMVNSGARGNMMQISQIAGMRGLVNNPKGEIIPRPILSNYKEGLSVLEYFIASHGSRKGLADTALKTAQSGYLTRRLVDVSQDVIIREDDCGTDRGVKVTIGSMVDGKLVRDPHAETSRMPHTAPAVMRRRAAVAGFFIAPSMG